MVAVRGGKRSRQSAPLTVHTLTAPVSQARLQGSWQVYAKKSSSAPGGTSGYLTWELSPSCAVGPCDVTVSVTGGGSFSFTMRLARTGAVYRGRALAGGERCGSGAGSIPDPATVKIEIRAATAVGQIQAWAATSFSGTMVVTYQYVSSAAGSCAAATFKSFLAGTHVTSLHEEGRREPVNPERCPDDGEDKLNRPHEIQVYQVAQLATATGARVYRDHG